MNLNMHILIEDLNKYDFQGKIIDDPMLRKLMFPTIYNNENHPLGDRVYLVASHNLPEAMDFSQIPSFICIGIPSQYYLQSGCNLIYTSASVSLTTMLNEILQIFNSYYLWEKEMQNINIQNLPLKNLGHVSDKIFKNPIHLYDANLLIIFSICNSPYYSLPDSYHIVKGDNSYLDMEDINILKTDEEYTQLSKIKEPAIMSEKLYGYRILVYNIYISDTYVARICIDEISHKFTGRDFSLIKVFGEALSIGIQKKDVRNYNRPKDLDEVLDKLLNHVLLKEDKIKTILKEYGWNIEDSYFCIVIEPTNFDQDNRTLSSLSTQLSAIIQNNCYKIFQNYIVFLYNLTQSGKHREDILNELFPQLRDSLLKAGISTVFQDFKNFYYYYLQAVNALTIGKKKDESFWYYRFEDYRLDYLIKNSRGNLIPETVCPYGLQRLISYDKVKHTSYSAILKTYLENNMNIAETSRKLYLHRNSLLHKLDKINNILQMDLNSPDVRLSLILAFRITENKI